jgi:hypothetical protein
MFKIGDRVRHMLTNDDEIIVEINSRGWIKGRYCKSGGLSNVFASPDRYKMVKPRYKIPEDLLQKAIDDAIQQIKQNT